MLIGAEYLLGFVPLEFLGAAFGGAALDGLFAPPPGGVGSDAGIACASRFCLQLGASADVEIRV